MLRPPNLELDPTGWTRIRSALEEALRTEPETRERVLKERLGDTPRLLVVGLELLAADEQGEDSTPLETHRKTPPESGLRVGPYVTRRVMGAGGMGTVYLAVRADGAFRRQVALKLIRPHLDTREVLARFQRERQVQANLEHPGIVRLLDGGETEDGRPYLVMEFVVGLRIDEYCDQHRLTNEERLKLFRKVADAVQHAHEQLVVHRDLKPSNILVTPEGEPKLLDFGIAKVLDPEKLGGEVEVTREMMRFVTPAYASPEQLRGLPVTAASDIYSLGVLLYRLLTGHPPHRLDGLSPAEVERRVCELDPARPSDAVLDTRELPAGDRLGTTTQITPQIVSERRGVTPRALRKGLAGDIDRLVGMCLRKEPQRRYPSAASLGEDIDRFLAGRPIFARPDSLSYRLRKFLWRNRMPAAMASGTILVLAGSLTYSIVQNRRVVSANADLFDQKRIADKGLARLRSMRGDIVREAQQIYSRVPEALEESTRLLRVVLRHIEEEAALALDDPEWLCEIGNLYCTLGKTLYSGRGAHLGRSEEALECYARAMEVLERAHDLRPRHRSAIYAMANVLDATAAAHTDQADFDSASARCEQVLDLLAPFAPVVESLDPVLVAQWCRAHDSLGRFRTEQGRTGEAREHAEIVVRGWEEFLRLVPEREPFTRGDLAMAQVRLADVMNDQGEHARAMELLEGAEPVLLQIVRSHETAFGPGRNFTVFLRTKAAAARGLGVQGAREYLEGAVDRGRTASAESPDDFRAQLDLTFSLYRLGEHLLAVGDLEAAEEIGLECLDHAESIGASWPDARAAPMRRGMAEVLMGELRLAQGAFAEASDLLGTGARRLEGMSETRTYWYARMRIAEASILRGRLYVAEADRATTPAEQRRALKQARQHIARGLTVLVADHQAGLGREVSRRLEEEARASTTEIQTRIERLQ